MYELQQIAHARKPFATVLRKASPSPQVLFSFWPDQIMAPKHFVHLVVDNGTYASTGGQLTVSPHVDFPAVALACGYRAAASCRGGDGLVEALDWAASCSGAGPVLLQVAVNEREAEGLERPVLSPQEIAQAFRDGVVGRR